MGIEVTQSATDNPAPSTAQADPAPPAAPAAATAAPEVLRDYGQRLSDALRAKGQELATEPAKRRALWPVAVAVVAGMVAARDVLAPTGPARASAATWMSSLQRSAARNTSEKTTPAATDMPV